MLETPPVDDDREDVEPNPEPDDVDLPTPGHPDTTPDDDAATEGQQSGIQGLDQFKS
jgi:hypothetical protein